MKDTNADLSKPNAATKQPNAFSASCDEVTSSKKRLEPRLMKCRKNGALVIGAIGLQIQDQRRRQKVIDTE